MSRYHCACGFAIDEADELGDHLREVFARDDETGTDGRAHAEITPPGQARPLVCACGFQAADASEFDDHILLVCVPADGIGRDGEKHVPVDPSTPIRWYIPGASGE